jgi:hypothetical protein
LPSVKSESASHPSGVQSNHILTLLSVAMLITSRYHSSNPNHTCQASNGHNHAGASGHTLAPLSPHDNRDQGANCPPAPHSLALPCYPMTCPPCLSLAPQSCPATNIVRLVPYHSPIPIHCTKGVRLGGVIDTRSRGAHKIFSKSASCMCYNGRHALWLRTGLPMLILWAMLSTRASCLLLAWSPMVLGASSSCSGQSLLVA